MFPETSLPVLYLLVERLSSLAPDHLHQTEGRHVDDLAVYPVLLTLICQKSKELLAVLFSPY